MACAPHYCNYHNTGLTTCAGHRVGCNTNRAIGWNDAVQSGAIYASQVEELRSAIVAEISRWKTHPWYAGIAVTETTAITAGTPIKASTFNNLNNMLIAAYGAVQSVTPSAVGGTTVVANSGAPAWDSVNISNYPSIGVASTGLVDDWNWDTLITQYDIVRKNCICNTDCSCNSICACYGNCGCNYSDERLKENIIFEGVKNGLNTYSWNYIWDATKRHVGVIAQELLGTKYEDALSQDADGFYMVNYAKLPI